MGGADILKELMKSDGMEQLELFGKVSHLVNRTTFNKNIRSLLKSRDIMKIERIKRERGLRHPVIKFFLTSP